MADTVTPPGVFVDQEHNPGGFSSWWKPAGPFLIAQPFTPVNSGRAFDMSVYISATEPNPSMFAGAAIHAFPLDGEMSPEPIDGGEGTLTYSEGLNAYGSYTATATFPNLPSLDEGVRYALVIDPEGLNGDGQASFQTSLGNAAPHNAQTKESGSWAGHMTGRLFFQLRMAPETITVTPQSPTYVPAEECGIAPVVQIPEQEGVVFSSTSEGNVEQVTAEPAEGYVFSAEAVTQWEFDVSVTPCPIEVTPLEPIYLPATCEAEHEVVVPDVDGVIYTVEDGEDTVRVSAAAADGYVLADSAPTSWEFDATMTPCPIEVTPLEPIYLPATCEAEHEVVVPDVDGVIYTVEDGEDTVRVSAAAADGYVLADSAPSSWEFDATELVCEAPGGDPAPDEDAPTPGDGELPRTGVGFATAGALTVAGLLVISGAVILACRHRATD